MHLWPQGLHKVLGVWPMNLRPRGRKRKTGQRKDAKLPLFHEVSESGLPRFVSRRKLNCDNAWTENRKVRSRQN